MTFLTINIPSDVDQDPTRTNGQTSVIFCQTHQPFLKRHVIECNQMLAAFTNVHVNVNIVRMSLTRCELLLYFKPSVLSLSVPALFLFLDVSNTYLISSSVGNSSLTAIFSSASRGKSSGFSISGGTGFYVLQRVSGSESSICHSRYTCLIHFSVLGTF